MRVHSAIIWVGLEPEEVTDYVEELAEKRMEEIDCLKGANIKQAVHNFAQNFFKMLTEDSDFSEFAITVYNESDAISVFSSQDTSFVLNKLTRKLNTVIKFILDECISIIEKDELSAYECSSFEEFFGSATDLYILYEDEDTCWYLENAFGYRLNLNEDE